MVLFGVSAVYTVDTWYLVRGRGGMFFFFFGWPGKVHIYMMSAPVLHFFVEITRGEV